MSRIKQDVASWSLRSLGIALTAAAGMDKSSALGEAYWRITVSNNEIDIVALVMDGYNAAVILVPSAAN